MVNRPVVGARKRFRSWHLLGPFTGPFVSVAVALAFGELGRVSIVPEYSYLFGQLRRDRQADPGDVGWALSRIETPRKTLAARRS
jgi:hypothetical protein